MTSQQTHSPALLRDALYELALAKEVPDAGLLDEFVRRYPEHAAALTDFAIELALDAALDALNTQTEPTPAVATPSVSKAMSRFHNRLYAIERERSTSGRGPAAVAENP